eukprot:4344249-Amphidinium_carterae.1
MWQGMGRHALTAQLSKNSSFGKATANGPWALGVSCFSSVAILGHKLTRNSFKGVAVVRGALCNKHVHGLCTSFQQDTSKRPPTDQKGRRQPHSVEQALQADRRKHQGEGGHTLSQLLPGRSSPQLWIHDLQILIGEVNEDCHRLP